MPFQYANEANPRAHYEGTGAEIAEALDRVDVLVAGLGTGGTLMGAGARLRESFPDVVVAAAEPLPGDPVMGLRSLEDGYVPPILDVSKLDRKLLVSNEEAVAGVHALLDREGIFAGRLERRRPPRRAPARGRARRGRRRLRPRRRRLEVPLRRLLAAATEIDESKLGGSPAARARGARRRTRGEELPNESCGLLVLRDGVADRYEPGRNAAESPYRFELEVDPDLWFLEDEGYELAVVHSHVSAPPRPSRTDVENVGLWQGRPYLIYSRRAGRAARRGRSPTARSSRSSSAEQAATTRPRPRRRTLEAGSRRCCGRSSNVTAICSIRLPSTSSTSKRMPSWATSSPRLGRAAELAEDEAADRVEVLVRQVGAEALVEVVDREHPVDAVRVLADLFDRLLGHVELVLDLADDLFEQVLERRDPDHRAVLVDHHREMAVRAPELLQQRGEILRLGDDVRRPQQRLEVEAARAHGRESP